MPVHPLSKETQSRLISTSLGVALYVHYPFCVHKCPYCDFASIGVGSDIVRDQLYISALIYEFERKAVFLQGAKLCSVYVGGGTPSLCAPEQWQRLLEVVKPYLVKDAELSIEVNPGTVDKARLKALRNAGFNRISLGVQSFNELALKRIGRIHDRKTALQACAWALEYFDDVNFDIMHGLPKQTLKEALADVKQVIEFRPSHFSWYELTIEEDTAFGQKPPVLPDEEVLEAIEEQGFILLEQAGYEHYEVSGYNLGGNKRCIHNQNYWLYGDYLGIGAGAHQKLTMLNPQLLSKLPNWRQNPEIVTKVLHDLSTGSLNLSASWGEISAGDVLVTKSDTSSSGNADMQLIKDAMPSKMQANAQYDDQEQGQGANYQSHSQSHSTSDVTCHVNAPLYQIYRNSNVESYQDYLALQLALAREQALPSARSLVVETSKSFGALYDTVFSLPRDSLALDFKHLSHADISSTVKASCSNTVTDDSSASQTSLGKSITAGELSLGKTVAGSDLDLGNLSLGESYLNESSLNKTSLNESSFNETFLNNTALSETISCGNSLLDNSSDVKPSMTEDVLSDVNLQAVSSSSIGEAKYVTLSKDGAVPDKSQSESQFAFQVESQVDSKFESQFESKLGSQVVKAVRKNKDEFESVNEPKVVLDQKSIVASLDLEALSQVIADPNSINYGLGHKVETEDIPYEFMLNRMRLWLDPISLKDIEFRMGLPFAVLEAKMNHLLSQGLLEIVKQEPNDQWFKPTDLGRRMLNEIIYTFIEE